jgi:NADPH2:quinone reductase
MTGGHGLHATVFPLILRGVSLLGISSNNCQYEIRKMLWDRLANEWKPPMLSQILTKEVGMDGLMPEFENMLAGASRGRTLVKIIN